MVLSYLAVFFITNNYGDTVYGRFSLTQTILEFLALLFSFGLTTATVKFTASKEFFYNGLPQNQFLKKTVIVLLFSSIVCSVGLFSIKNWFSTVVFEDKQLLPYLKYLSFFMVFIVFHAFFSEFLRGKGKFFQYALFRYALPNLGFLLFLVVFYQFQLKEETTILAYLISIFILSLVMLFYFPFKLLNTKTSFKYSELLAVSFPMLFSSAFLFLSNWTDVFMLGKMVSKADLGVYNASYKLSLIALVVINAVNTVLAPKISKLYSENKLKAIGVEVQHATKLITIITLPMVIVLLVFRIPVLSLYGEAFVRGEYVLIVVSLGLLFNSFSGSVGQILNMTNHQKVLKRFTLYSLLINISFNYFLILRYGILGAAIASVISNVFLNTLCVIFIKKKFNFYAFYQPWKQF